MCSRMRSPRTVTEKALRVFTGWLAVAWPVPPQNPVDRTIVDVSALGVKLAYPDASLAVRPASDRQIEPEVAAHARR